MTGGEVRSIGREAQRLVAIDDFATDPDALRRAAAIASFAPATHHYPGMRAPLPDDYLVAQRAAIADAVAEAFGHHGPIRLIDASFSIVITPAEQLSIRQRLPHCDAFGAERIALVHYLSLADDGGTAFYRHRSTGFETIDEARAPIFFGQLEAELRHRDLPTGYVAGDTPPFERLAMVEARYNRAALYRSFVLHSGSITPGATLSPDPAAGRLTVTAFFSLA